MGFCHVHGHLISDTCPYCAGDRARLVESQERAAEDVARLRALAEERADSTAAETRAAAQREREREEERGESRRRAEEAREAHRQRLEDLEDERVELERERADAEEAWRDERRRRFGACTRCGAEFVEATRVKPKVGRTWTNDAAQFSSMGVCPRCYHDYIRREERAWTQAEEESYWLDAIGEQTQIAGLQKLRNQLPLTANVQNAFERRLTRLRTAEGLASIQQCRTPDALRKIIPDFVGQPVLDAAAQERLEILLKEEQSSRERVRLFELATQDALRQREATVNVKLGRLVRKIRLWGVLRAFYVGPVCGAWVGLTGYWVYMHLSEGKIHWFSPNVQVGVVAGGLLVSSGVAVWHLVPIPAQRFRIPEERWDLLLSEKTFAERLIEPAAKFNPFLAVIQSAGLLCLFIVMLGITEMLVTWILVVSQNLERQPFLRDAMVWLHLAATLVAWWGPFKQGSFSADAINQGGLFSRASVRRAD